MIDTLIRNYLKSVFQLPCVHDVGQTNVEKCVSYAIDSIKVVTRPNSEQTFEVSATVLIRSQSGYETLGVLSYGLVGNPNGDGLHCRCVSGVESVEYENKTEIIVQKSVIFTIKLDADQVRERIKNIILEK